MPHCCVVVLFLVPISGRVMWRAILDSFSMHLTPFMWIPTFPLLLCFTPCTPSSHTRKQRQPCTRALTPPHTLLNTPRPLQHHTCVQTEPTNPGRRLGPPACVAASSGRRLRGGGGASCGAAPGVRLPGTGPRPGRGRRHCRGGREPDVDAEEDQGEWDKCCGGGGAAMTCIRLASRVIVWVRAKLRARVGQRERRGSWAEPDSLASDQAWVRAECNGGARSRPSYNDVALLACLCGCFTYMYSV